MACIERGEQFDEVLIVFTPMPQLLIGALLVAVVLTKVVEHVLSDVEPIQLVKVHRQGIHRGNEISEHKTTLLQCALSQYFDCMTKSIWFTIGRATVKQVHQRIFKLFGSNQFTQTEVPDVNQLKSNLIEIWGLMFPPFPAEVIQQF